MMISNNDNADIDNTADANTKILDDLQTVSKQINLCKSLFTHNQSSSDYTLLNAIEFLQLCSPRMIELIEAGSQGFLSEETVIKCLEVNDELCKTLNEYQDIDKRMSQPISVSSNFTIDDDLRDLIMDTHSTASMKPSPTSTAAHEGKSSGLDEETKPKFAEASDDFDSFFDQRFSPKQQH